MTSSVVAMHELKVTALLLLLLLACAWQGGYPFE